MNISPKKVGSFYLKNGQKIDVYGTCSLDGYCLYYQNEVLAWKSYPLSEIKDFGELMVLGNFPSAI